MDTKRVKLDIDPTIIEKNLIIAGNGSGPGELDSLFPKHDEIKSKLIQPAPGFCIKIKSTSNEKVFINACHTTDLPAPEELSEENLLEILQSDARSNYRVPMSIGQGRVELDKQGQPANAYDIAINTSFMSKLDKSSLFKDFFVTLAIEAIEEKYSLELNRETLSILKHKKCMGTLQRHRVQQREVEKVMGLPTKPLIEEISSTENLVETKNIPPHRFTKEPAVGPTKAIIGEIKLTGMMSVKDLTLDVGEDRLFLVTSGNVGYNLDTFFDYNIDQNKVTAAFNKRNGMLIVNMPLIAV